MADQEPSGEKPGLIGSTRNLFGLKLSAEDQEKLARLKEGLAEMEDIKRNAHATWEEEFRQIAEAERAESKRQNQAVRDQIHEQNAHRPTQLDAVNDIPLTPEGRPITQDIRLIHKWDDGYGHIVYVSDTRADILRGHIIGPPQIKPLSDRITTQQTSFAKLESQEQSRLHGEFNTSNSTAEVIQPYKDYLQNEALRRRFEELKANPPKPFGNK